MPLSFMKHPTVRTSSLAKTLPRPPRAALALPMTLWLACLLTTQGQISLQPGQTFTYEFTSLPLLAENVPNPSFYCAWNYERGSLQPGDTASWQFSGPLGVIWASLISLTEAPPDWDPGVGQMESWPEIRGAIEISFSPESTGTLNVGAIVIQASTPSLPGAYNFYGITLVPEPSVGRVLMLGLPWLWWCRKGKGSPVGESGP